MKKTTAVFLLFLFYQFNVGATTLKRIYLDNYKNVHIITSTGKQINISKKIHAMEVELSPDKKTAVWLVEEKIDMGSGLENASLELGVYNEGRVRTIGCGRIIRSYWFWMNGKRIAIDCGGKHFAGHEILYDTSTLVELVSFDQAEVPLEKRPSWSKSGDNFDDK